MKKKFLILFSFDDNADLSEFTEYTEKFEHEVVDAWIPLDFLINQKEVK